MRSFRHQVTVVALAAAPAIFLALETAPKIRV